MNFLFIIKSSEKVYSGIPFIKWSPPVKKFNYKNINSRCDILVNQNCHHTFATP